MVPDLPADGCCFCCSCCGRGLQSLCACLFGFRLFPLYGVLSGMLYRCIFRFLYCFCNFVLSLQNTAFYTFWCWQSPDSSIGPRFCHGSDSTASRGELLTCATQVTSCPSPRKTEDQHIKLSNMCIHPSHIPPLTLPASSCEAR